MQFGCLQGLHKRSCSRPMGAFVQNKPGQEAEIPDSVPPECPELDEDEYWSWSNDGQASKDDPVGVNHIFQDMGVPVPVSKRRPSTDDEDVDED